MICWQESTPPRSCRSSRSWPPTIDGNRTCRHIRRTTRCPESPASAGRCCASRWTTTGDGRMSPNADCGARFRSCTATASFATGIYPTRRSWYPSERSSDGWLTARTLTFHNNGSGSGSGAASWARCTAGQQKHDSPLTWKRVRLFFVEEFLPYSWAFLPADASLQCSFRGDSNQASAYPRLSGGQPSLETVPNTVGLSPSGALPSGHSRGVLVRCRGKGGRPAMAVTTGFQGRTFDLPRTCVPCIDPPRRAPCAAADAVFADAKAFLSSSEARQMSESELERELHRRGQELVRKLLQGHPDQRSPKEAAGPAEDTSGVECSEPHEHESHAETTSGTMQVVGLGCARRGHDGLHRLDAALNRLPERYLVEMRRRVTIATASRAPPRTPWKPPWYSTSSTWQRRRGVRCSSPAHRRACRHLVRDPMGVDRPAVTLGCSCGCPQPPRAAGALMRTETSHEAREDQRKSPIGR